MKVGLIIYGSLDTLSGGYLYDRKLVEHLRSRGDRVEIFALPWRDYGRHLLDNLDSALLRRILAADLDVLIQDELNHPSLIRLNSRLKALSPLPVVALVHHLRCSEARPRWQNALYAAIERRYLHGVDAFIFNSHTTRRSVEDLTRARPCVVAHPGADRLGRADGAHVARRAHLPAPLRLLFLGNVIERKALHTLIEAMALPDAADWVLDVVGGLSVEPHTVAACRALIEKRRLGPRVTFHGALLDDALTPFLQRSHALAVPSTWEGFGIVYMEAAAFGLPAIAGSAGAAGEVVADGISGHLVAPHDAAAIARHLHAWAQDRAALAQMAQAALTRFDAHPTWAQTAEATRAFLLTLRETQTPHTRGSSGFGS